LGAAQRRYAEGLSAFSLSKPETLVALSSIAGIVLHLALGFPQWPLVAVLLTGGAYLVFTLVRHMLRGEFGADFLAAVSIVSSLILEEYLAGAVIVLMLSGGEALESYATRRASSVLDAVARRMPETAHRYANGQLEDIPVSEVHPGDRLALFPHEICPVDGVVLEGSGSMDEAYLTGEPYEISKSPGAQVLSGAINGPTALTIRANKPASSSRYAQIMQVLAETEQNRPRLRRLADRLGAWYTPFALAVASLAWAYSGDPKRFLAVVVVATPCPLLIAIPVAVIGAISLAARRGILIRNAQILEQVSTCRIFVFDKTGTLTYGAPELSEILTAPGHDEASVLSLVAGLERYSRHPLAQPILNAAASRALPLQPADEVHELPGQGLHGRIAGRHIEVTGRRKAEARGVTPAPESAGLECVILIDNRYAALFRFRDLPRKDTRDFVQHLKSRHASRRVVLLSGDRESEVRYLAQIAGIEEVHSSQSPEQKVEFVKNCVAQEPTLFVGDGINDAPALLAATAGIALGDKSGIAAQSAGAVILTPDLRQVDQLLHIARRMRRIALQSALGGIALSLAAMALASTGALTPTLGALTQEAIDIFAVLNALRVSITRDPLSDY
jgi:heavy metal translocating P-type ATPase